ncbi:MAG: exo-alpha-sialidase [Bacteroidales bacterium]|nr:exo-alpha-sialidase [Bacteroidales bacterium]
MAITVIIAGCADITPRSRDGESYSMVIFSKGNPEGVACYRIPSLVTAPNGDLIAVADERVPSCGDLKWSRDINLVIRRSSDNGRSWSATEKVVDFPDGQSASDPSMIVDEITGDIFLFYNYMDHDREKDVYYLHYVRSSDNGKTWSSPIDITDQITTTEWKYDFKFITSGRGTQLRSGRLLHTIVNLEKGLHLFGSDDHGNSWFLIDSPIKPADESIVTELTDGTLMVNSRVNGAGMRYVHTSGDGGFTWETEPDTMLPDPGCNAGLIRYTQPGNRKPGRQLLFINANSPTSRENITLQTSSDEGNTWNEIATIYKGSAAYSAITVMKRGSVGILYERNDYGEIVFTTNAGTRPGSRRP